MTGKESIQPFDWTYTTEYQGTLSSEILVSVTEEKIDVAKYVNSFRQCIPLFSTSDYLNLIRSYSMTKLSSTKMNSATMAPLT